LIRAAILEADLSRESLPTLDLGSAADQPSPFGARSARLRPGGPARQALGSGLDTPSSSSAPDQSSPFRVRSARQARLGWLGSGLDTLSSSSAPDQSSPFRVGSARQARLAWLVSAAFGYQRLFSYLRPGRLPATRPTTSNRLPPDLNILSKMLLFSSRLFSATSDRSATSDPTIYLRPATS
jgi:hypothetical protein